VAWPKGRPRPKKVGSELEPTIIQEGSPELVLTQVSDEAIHFNTPPSDWRKGALLNVRNRGDAYVITLYPEESHPERPERELRFTNPGVCQDFISAWYAAEHHDPRAR
jgi:hypothetical protein